MAKKKEYTCVLVETDRRRHHLDHVQSAGEAQRDEPDARISRWRRSSTAWRPTRRPKSSCSPARAIAGARGWTSSSIFARPTKIRWRASAPRRRTGAGRPSCLPGRASRRIAMVNGYCYGGAFVSLAACDIVIAADTATFGLSEVNWGIIPGGNVSKVFGDMVSFRNAMFYAMTGRTIDGRKAVELGIATLSVPPEKLREETVTVARELMAKSPDGARLHQASDPRRARHGHGSGVRVFGSEKHGLARRRSRTDAGARHARIPRRKEIPPRIGAGEAADGREMS